MYRLSCHKLRSRCASRGSRTLKWRRVRKAWGPRKRVSHIRARKHRFVLHAGLASFTNRLYCACPQPNLLTAQLRLQRNYELPPKDCRGSQLTVRARTSSAWASTDLTGSADQVGCRSGMLCTIAARATQGFPGAMFDINASKLPIWYRMQWVPIYLVAFSVVSIKVFKKGPSAVQSLDDHQSACSSTMTHSNLPSRWNRTFD
jgi:hypothetical protein